MCVLFLLWFTTGSALPLIIMLTIPTTLGKPGMQKSALAKLVDYSIMSTCQARCVGSNSVAQEDVRATPFCLPQSFHKTLNVSRLLHPLDSCVVALLLRQVPNPTSYTQGIIYPHNMEEFGSWRALQHYWEPPRLPLPQKHPKLRPWSELSLPRNSDHGLSFSFPQVQSLGWSGFWSEFFLDHGLSFLPRGQKHWGRGRRLSLELYYPSVIVALKRTVREVAMQADSNPYLRGVACREGLVYCQSLEGSIA